MSSKDNEYGRNDEPNGDFVLLDRLAEGDGLEARHDDDGYGLDEGVLKEIDGTCNNRIKGCMDKSWSMRIYHRYDRMARHQCSCQFHVPSSGLVP